MKHETLHDIIILGAGASGLMAATQLKEHSIAIIDHNPSPGKKILISGGGKCNVTNEDVTAENYHGCPQFIQPILDQFTPDDLLSFLAQYGVHPQIRSEGQYFCQQSAQEVVSIFQSELREIPRFFNQNIQSVTFDKQFHIQTDKQRFKAKKVIVATGGLSYTQIGASSIGHEIATSFGHTITPTAPALVGFTVQKEQFWMKELSGINFEIKAGVNHKSFSGNLLFAHKGISGPVILNASLYWKKGTITLDFLPDFHINKLDRHNRKQLSSILPLPKRFSKLFLENIGLSDRPLRDLRKEEWKQLESIHHYEMAPAGTFGYSKAEATRGGVNTDELHPLSSESRLQKGLYFIGEVSDITGELGGYNFQWAFASAVSCARAILTQVKG